jgi:internalin A
VHGKAPGFFLDILRDTLEHLCNIRWPGLKYDLHVPCRTEACPGRFPLRSLERLREARQREVQCLDCLQAFDTQGLLTGFEGRPEATLEIARRELTVIRRDVAHNLMFVRTIIKTLGTEVVDCPRIFTIAARRGTRFDSLNFWSMRYTLTLWCEEPGAEHPAGRSYSFRKPEQWFVDVAPYLRIAARVVSLVAPIVGNAAMLADDAAVGVERSADLMKAIADAINLPVSRPPSGGSVLTPAEGAALRRLRELLLELDPSRGFCGLRRVLSPTGDYIWLCAEHYVTYEPSLPTLPYTTE